MKFVVLLTFGVLFSSGATPEKALGNSAPGAQVRAAQPSDIGDAQVDKWMKSWRKRLALEDWEITTQLVRSSELKPDTFRQSQMEQRR